MRRVHRFSALTSRRQRAVLLAAAVSLAAVAPLVGRPVVAEDKGSGRPEISHAAGAAGGTVAPGYWLVADDGGVFSYGSAAFLGSTGAIRLNRPIVGMAATPSGSGYWLVADDGGIFSFGDAGFFGSTGAIRLNRPIVGMAPTPTGAGYWMVASDGGIFSFGDAGFFGSTGAIRLNRPIVGMAATPSGSGYWLVAGDGGTFAFGDARFFGSTGGIPLARPITGIAPTPSGGGYWMVASDGGVFSFGDAAYHGSAPERPAAPPRSVVALVPSPTGAGYWQASATGERLAFGDAADLGGPAVSGRPIVGMAGPPAGPVAADRGAAGVLPAAEPTTTTTVPSVWSGPPGPPERFASAADATWGTSISTVEAAKAGRVLALAEAGNMIFVGGEFNGAALPGTAPDGDPACQPAASPLAPPTSCVLRPFLFALDANTGALLDWDAHPDDAVLSLAASPDGRQLYVGGRFTSIGGAPAGHLALLDIATATQVPAFHPPSADSGVHALALHGDTLYIGGSFRHLTVDGASVPAPAEVAALDAATGALRPGFPRAENTGGRFVGHTGTPTEDGNPGVVYDMAVSADGGTVYVAGDFLHFGGQGGLVALDAATGAPTAWQPVFDMRRPAFGVTIWPGDGTSVVASTGGPGGSIQFFTPSHGSSPVWVGRTDGDATDVVATTERVYGVGHWDHGVPTRNDPCLRQANVDCPDGTPHRKLIAFDARTGATDPGFTAQANTPQGPYVALVGAHHLYVGGDFTEVGPLGALRPQGGFAAFDQTG